MQTATSLTQLQTPFQTAINTARYTPIPTNTVTLTILPTIAIATTEPVPFTSFGNVFLAGTDLSGGSILRYPDDPFQLFGVQPNQIASFQFTMEVQTFHFIKNQLTPAPTAIPTASWRLLIYRYRTVGAYTNQPGLETNLETVITTYPDKLLNMLSAEVAMQELQATFGDCSAFTFQVIDEHGKLQQQGYFSINPHHLFFYEGAIKGNYQEGVALGYPYSLQQKEVEFFHHGRFVLIHEPPGGFYRLPYVFDFVHASGVSATSEQEKVAIELSLKVFPYRDDGKYSLNNSQPATAILHSTVGYLLVDLPIDYLQEQASDDGEYYLQITDGTGRIIKDDYFLFVPYTP